MESNHSSTRDGPSHLPAKSSKRLKLQGNESSHLPAETWAAVMEYLEFSSVLTMTAASRTMRDAASFVTEIHVDKSCQMHANVARRFTNVNRVFIRQLVRDLTEEEDDELKEEDEDIVNGVCIVDHDTTMRTVPFISTFAKLEQVCFGIWGFTDEYDSPYQPLCMHFQTTNEKGRFSALIDMFSYGFQSGILPSSLEIKGLYCPDFHVGPIRLVTMMVSRNNRRCDICERACRSFPVSAVSRFKHDQASIHDNIGVCIGRERLAEILKSRPGGEEALCSPYHLFNLLRSCTDTHLGSHNGKDLSLVNIDGNTCRFLHDELRRSGLDATKLEPSQVSAAILSSFSSRKGDMFVLSDHSRKALEKLGIAVCDDLRVSKGHRSNAIKEYLPHMNTKGYQWILREFPSLFESGLDLDNKLFLKHIIDCDFVAGLISLLTKPPGPNSSCHLQILSKITNVTLQSIAGVVKWNNIMPSSFFQPTMLSKIVNIESDTPAAAINEHDATYPIKILKKALSNPSFYQTQFNGSYPFRFSYFCGRFIVKDPLESGTKVGSIIVAINFQVLPQAPIDKILRKMKNAIKEPSRRSAVVTFVEDSEFTNFFTNTLLPYIEKKREAKRIYEQKEKSSDAKKR